MPQAWRQTEKEDSQFSRIISIGKLVYFVNHVGAPTSGDVAHAVNLFFPGR
jgi:hypothetical protein